MSETLFQRLQVHLKGGQTISIDFQAQKAEQLNPQIESFLKALGDATKKEGNFLFQGARVLLVRLADVSACDVVSLIAKQQAAPTKE